MGALTSHNPTGLNGLLQGYLYLMFYLFYVKNQNSFSRVSAVAVIIIHYIDLLFICSLIPSMRTHFFLVTYSSVGIGTGCGLEDQWVRFGVPVK
jgi:membrane protein YdbS with pleckstrin-like domain